MAKVGGTMSKSLQEQANELLAKAEAKGAATNYLFKTTFGRYQVQIKVMEDLEKEIAELGATVKKEYVKGRKNVYTNPAITEYNKTATAANGTVATLIKILESVAMEEREQAVDPLRELLQEIADG